MRVAIVGAGGLGAFYGGLLARSGADVTFIARGANLEALRNRGLTVRLDGAPEFHIDARATGDPREVGPVDLIWCCVKAYDVEPAMRMALPMVGPETMIIPIQNGIDSPDRIAAIAGPRAALGGVGRAGGTLVEPGVVVQKGRRNMVVFGELAGGLSPRVEALAAALKGTGIEAEASPNARGVMWDKFISFSGQAGPSALTRLPLGPLRALPETRALMLGIMAEVQALAKAKGIVVPPGAAERVVQGTSLGGGSYPSTYFDLMEGRRLELDAIYGTTLRLGAEIGIPTPLNGAIYALLKPYENGAPQPATP
ncbi:MAG: 2-dehydropantoate 2-reductase [Dehalococcoidia bacterium]|nr:2-dehydropantoate 2-reductase [Dehalococcoidia bacterium]